MSYCARIWRLCTADTFPLRNIGWSPKCIAKGRRPSAGPLSLKKITTTATCRIRDKDAKPKRGGKRTTVKLRDLPQGFVAAQDAPETPTAEEPSPPSSGYPTVIQQARDNMNRFSTCVVLTRVGGFYELYFHQAEHWGSQLNLKIARKKTSAGPVPMVGFPQSQLARYLKVLVQDHGMHVAIAEEIANDPSQRVKSGGLLFDRQVKRILTPGTLIDEDFIAPNEHNYLLGICSYGSPGGPVLQNVLSPGTAQGAIASIQLSLAWIDLSSGEFLVQRTNISSLASHISRIAPREIVADERLSDIMNGKTFGLALTNVEKVAFIRTDNVTSGSDNLNSAVEDVDDVPVPAFSDGDLFCANVLVNYVQEQLPGLKLRLQPPQTFDPAQHMSIDKTTLRGLEIMKTLKDGTATGSLLHSVRKTSTRSGARLLAERLVSPSTSLAIINERLDLVQELISKPQLVDEINALLERTTDSFRLLQAIALGKGDAQDLLSLSGTIALTRQISHALERNTEPGAKLQAMLHKFSWEQPQQLAENIRNAIDEEGLMARYRVKANEAAEAATIAQEAIAAEDATDMAALHKRLASISKKSDGSQDTDEDDVTPSDEIWIMRRNAGYNLGLLHDRLAELRQEEKRLTSSLQTQLDAKSLALKFSPNLGHFVYVKGKDAKLDPSRIIPEARMAGSSKSTRSFYLPAWTSLGKSMESAKLRIRSEEQLIFKALRTDVCNNIVALRRNAGVLDELDVACSNAMLARECNLVRPVLDSSTSMHVFNGRHMTVEAGLRAQGRSFTSNDTIIGRTNSHDADPAGVDQADSKIIPYQQKSIHLITGPNMAGKSTYLRQLAIIAILAQTGSYIPASFARLGVVDAVFSRIGSADNLYQDQSTFMVEMMETAEILQNAGPRSLVVMDEVGRGTSPEDGTAVGYAVLETLRRHDVGRVLFATHFHKIVDMCQQWPEVQCSCTRVVEKQETSGASFRFDHKMRPGVNRDSHALKVAKLAGLPEETIHIAGDALKDLKQTWKL